MSRIFISHSSKDEAEAIALKDWLVAQGWGDDEDIFLDLDPQRGLVGGERWKEALRRNIRRCEAVVFVITPAWRASEWCLAEYQLAESFHKPIFGVITKRFKLADLPGNMAADWQVVNLTRSGEQKKFSVTAVTNGKTDDVSFNSAELTRLKAGLVNTGVDPRYFEWPPQGEPDRPPYLGLKALQKEDAGIFFGRDGQIVEALDCLRGLHDGPPPRMLVILGASGAGKSSFMRAGVLPRLERDDRHFTVLNPVRPGERPLTGDTGLIASIEAEAKLSGLSLSRNDITKTVMRAVADDADGNANAGTTAAAEPLKELFRSIAASRSSEDATSTTSIALPVDQMEELYFAGGDKGNHEAEQLRALLTELTTCEDLRLIVVATIRSDSYEHIQFDQVLGSVDHQTMSLPPIPQGSYSEIIRGPIRRLVNTDTPLKIDDQLVGELLKDIAEGGAKDALPLLAFTLERLYTEYTRDNTLRLSDYEDMGRIRGSIEKAVEQAFANADATIVADHDQRLKLLRHGLIPWLARVDPETSEPMRRIAPYTSIPEISRPLIDLLVEQRLLSTDTRLVKGNNGQHTGETEVTIEPTHEALLRQWGRLEKWLDEDKELLSALDAVKQASRDWDANDKEAEWLAHMAGRLETALTASNEPRFANFLDPLDTNYLQACTIEDRKRRNAEIEAQKKITKRTRMGAIAASVLMIVAGGLGWYGWEKAEVAKTAIVNVQRQLAYETIQRAESLLDNGQVELAVSTMLEASDKLTDIDVSDKVLIPFDRALNQLNTRLTFLIPSESIGFEYNNKLFFSVGSKSEIYRVTDAGISKKILGGSGKFIGIYDLLPHIGPTIAFEKNSDLYFYKFDPIIGVGEKLLKFDSADVASKGWNINVGLDGVVLVKEHTPERILRNRQDIKSNYHLGRLDSGKQKRLLIPNLGGLVVDSDGKSIIYIDVESTPPPGDLLGVKHMIGGWTPYINGFECFGPAIAAKEIAPAVLFLKAVQQSGKGWIRECKFAPPNIAIITNESTSAGYIDYLFVGPEFDDEELNHLEEGTIESVSIFSAKFIDRGVTATRKFRDLKVAFHGNPLYGYQSKKFRFPSEIENAVIVSSEKIALILGLEDPNSSHKKMVLLDYANVDKYGRSNAQVSYDADQLQDYLKNDGFPIYSVKSQEVCLPDSAVNLDSKFPENQNSKAITFKVESSGNDIKAPLKFFDGHTCINISPSGEYYYVKLDRKLEVYASITGKKMGVRLFSEPLYHVGFADDSNPDLLLSEGTAVSQWKQQSDGEWKNSLLYKAENPVASAHLSPNQTRLLLHQFMGRGYVKSSIYSIEAKRIWKSVGNSYKWYGAEFSTDGDVYFSNASGNHIHHLNNLREARKQAQLLLNSL